MTLTLFGVTSLRHTEGVRGLDAVVIGAGPNGLSAAITLARAGLKVQLREAQAWVGGGLSSGPLTLPGFTHDLGSAIHPLAAASPAFRTWPLHAFGLDWMHSPAPLAHVLDGRTVLLKRSLEETAEQLGPDAAAYRRLLKPLVDRADQLLPELLKPMLRLPHRPLLLAQYGLRGLLPASAVARVLFQTREARALWAGVAAHTGLPLDQLGTSAMTLVLALLGHTVGWPFPRGGAQMLANALADYLRFLGGELLLNQPVSHLCELPPARVVLLDSSPKVLLDLLGERLPAHYVRTLERFRYGCGIQKFDYALSGPVPWRDPHTAQAATVHVGGSLEEVMGSERTLCSERPFLLAAQHTLFDGSRSPQGNHTLWVYTHVPNGDNTSVKERVEAQLERFAPGFKRRILACQVTDARALELFSPVGGFK